MLTRFARTRLFARLREEQWDGIVSWIVLAVGLAAAAAAVIALLKPALTTAAHHVISLITGSG